MALTGYFLQLEANCAQLKSELGALHQQLQQEIGTKGAMETVLAESREDTFKQRQTSEELAQELDYLRNEITKIKYVRFLWNLFAS
jgi:chromosome segregation ATPase